LPDRQAFERASIVDRKVALGAGILIMKRADDARDTGETEAKVARSICCSVIETLVLTVGSSAASRRMRSTRALIEELSLVSNPRLVFMPWAMASSRDSFNGFGVASAGRTAVKLP